MTNPLMLKGGWASFITSRLNYLEIPGRAGGFYFLTVYLQSFFIYSKGNQEHSFNKINIYIFLYILKMKNLFIFLMILPYHGSSGVTDEKSVSVNEGESVTLHTGVKTNQQEEIAWYFNNSRIARIIGDQSDICTDVQCKERFRDRLKLDHQTGSLTIMNTRNTDSGEYKLAILSHSSGSDKIFRVAVNDGPSARRGEMKTKSVVEGEYVTLDPGEINHPNVVMTWYFNETLIAEITGDQSEICSDVQCKERFRDRLKLDHQTGSLIITDTRTTDSGEYKLQISSRNNNSSSVVVTSLKSFSVSITVAGLSAGGKAGICVAVLLIIAASVCGFYFYKRRVNKKDTGTQHNDQVRYYEH
ncbi:uncharacterized protein LOC113039542 [Carassius auratus]|uniref:Uncharacterized protein LOC113039542 n=1 Tax=Carassius auratus TaxID=7957 RepID=A0A6P6IZP0_CARAU|nr:uncharacterized protein LOC113039542 [Carassius auratus]